MLRINRLKLLQFRNYKAKSFDLDERIIGICGDNGTGKTNLLDAIYYLCLTRSYFSRPDGQNVTHGMQGMRIDGEFDREDGPHTVTCILRENNRKEFLADNEPYRRLSEHIGRFPCVMIAPDDVELISGSSEQRRNFIDAILCQLNPEYLQQLIAYNKILQQRNSFLKQASESNAKPDEALLGTYDDQLGSKGQTIYEVRVEFMRHFLPLVLRHYEKIAEKRDGLAIQYTSQLSSSPLKAILQHTLQKDLALQRTSAGIHKDDLEIYIGEYLFRSQASQGQRKSLLFALKLAEWDVLRENKGFSPILLLDDVFEKLDAQRMHNLLHWVCAENEGQVFITDTHRARLTEQLADIKVGFKVIELGIKN
jgi:DNA replication and repair protein RecF